EHERTFPTYVTDNDEHDHPDDRSEGNAREKEPQALRVGPEDDAGEDRDERLIVAEHRERRLDREHQRQDRARAHISEPAHELAADRTAHHAGDARDPHREQAADDREIARRVHEERPCRTGARDEDPGDRRAYEIRALEEHRVERYGVLQLPAWDERREE